MLSAFETGLQQAFKRDGVSSQTFDILSDSEGHILSHFAEDMPECTIGFNVIPNHLPFEELGIPHVALIVDCATYYPEIFECKNAVAAFVEEDSCGFVRQCGHKHVIFFPHAIDKSLLVDTFPEKKRDLDVVMCGSFSDAELIRGSWELILSKKAQDLLMDMAEEVLASSDTTHLELFVKEMEKKGEFANEILEKGLPAFSLMNWLEVYIRGVDRTRFIEAIDADVHIFGSEQDEEQWKKALKKKKNLIFHKPVPYEQLPSLFMRAKAVLNSMPTIKRGLHERLLMALARGATVLTNDNIFLSKTFGKHEALLTVTSKDYSAANELLKNAFQDEEKRIKDVLSTHTIIREGHTFEVRAKMLQDVLPPIIEEIRASK